MSFLPRFLHRFPVILFNFGYLQDIFLWEDVQLLTLSMRAMVLQNCVLLSHISDIFLMVDPNIVMKFHNFDIFYSVNPTPAFFVLTKTITMGERPGDVSIWRYSRIQRGATFSDTPCIFLVFFFFFFIRVDQSIRRYASIGRQSRGTGRQAPSNLMFFDEGDTISNVPFTNWSKFIFYFVENCHSQAIVLLTIFKHFKHQNDNFSRASRAFTTKLYTIFNCFILFSARFPRNVSFLYFILV